MIRTDLCPGDCLMLTAAVRDLKAAYPSIKINVETKHPDIWKYNPNIDVTIKPNNAERYVYANYNLINNSNQAPFHFIHGYRMDLARQLQMPIPCGPFKVDVHFSEEEKNDYMIPELRGKRYWVLNAGYKFDYTLKAWEMARYQEVVNRLKDRITFVQIGKRDPNWSYHPKLENVVDLTDKTTLRDVLRIIYHSSGVLTGVSFTSLAATMEGPPDVIRLLRPAVVIGAGREPAHWQQMPGHFYLHRCGIFDCNEHGGCWNSRIDPLREAPEKNGRICPHPVVTPSGQRIPLCMDMITVDEVVNLINQIEDAWALNPGRKTAVTDKPKPNPNAAQSKPRFRTDGNPVAFGANGVILPQEEEAAEIGLSSKMQNMNNLTLTV